MRYIGIEFPSRIIIAVSNALSLLLSALIAIGRARMIFAVTARTMHSHFTTWHSHERAIGTLDYFQITHHKTIVKRNATECL
jgi:hypothetical protein